MAEKKLKTIVGQGIRDLFPGYFALVMATGIISIATYLLNMTPVAWFLFWLNLVAYAVLVLLTLIRLAKYFPQLLADMTSHTRGPGFFTIVAGTCVLGSQFVVLAEDTTTAMIFWFVGILLWIVIMYSFFTAMTVRTEKPPLESGLNGAWLIAIVATQSISVLGTIIASRFTAWQEEVLFLTLSFYLIGGMLYIITIPLIFYRFTFFKMPPEALTPPYWINMGAVAITTLSGASLILSAPQWPFLGDILPFLKGFTLFFWAAGAWWIPLLLILGAWLHIYKRFPLRYNPQYWGIVFPLGMYTTCTFQLAKALDLQFLYTIPDYVVYPAIFAWLAAFIGLIYSLIMMRL